MGASVGPNLVTDQLSLYLDAPNKKSYPGSGTTWFDLSGNNYHFTNTGATYNTKPNRFTFGDNEGDHLETGNNGAVGGFTAITTSMWIYHNDQANLVFISYATAANNNSYLLYKQSANLHVHKGDSDPFDYANHSSFTVPIDTWYNFTHTNNGSTDKLYINAVEISSISFSFGTLLTGGRVVIGQEQDNVGGGFQTDQDFPGSYANLSIYNRALSAAEIQQNYNALKTRYGL